MGNFVLRILDWFFNGNPQDLSAADLAGGTADRVRVEVEFGDLTDQDREVLGQYAPDETGVVTLWKTWEAGEEYFSGNARAYHDFEARRVEDSAKPKREVYDRLRQADPDLALPNISRAADIEPALRRWESKIPSCSRMWSSASPYEILWIPRWGKTIRTL